MTKGQRAGNGAIAVEVEEGKSYYWCSCGKSSKQPFCDSSHKGTDFNPIVYKAKETKKILRNNHYLFFETYRFLWKG